MNIIRTLQSVLLEDAQGFKVLAILGPRQSGKTTLARTSFPNYNYVTLENPDTKLRASQDPKNFLHDVCQGDGLILDEFQNVPELLSYIQGIVDEQPRKGFFVLTGSQNFLMNQAITQTLAGRISIHTLLPFSIQELNESNISSNLNSTLCTGFYPPLYNQKPNVERWFASYVQTYLERDVRDLKHVSDLNLFQLFVKLCAGRIGQILNISSLANDCGISVNTARSWLSLLEASYIVFTLKPHHKNFSKRLIKSPKIYFHDVGLAAALLKILPDQISTHYLRGGLFENMILSELHKSFYNLGIRPNIYFWRDQTGHEVDVIIENGQQLIPIEIKSSMTIGTNFFDGLTYWNNLAQADPKNGFVVYAGEETQTWKFGKIQPWKNTCKIIDFIR